MDDQKFDLLVKAKVESDELSSEQLKELLEQLKQREIYKKFNRSEYFKPYPYQHNFYQLGSHKRYRFLMAGNRIGKTFSQAYESYLHLTGLYPEWWKGRRFNKPINFWFLAVSVEQSKDVGQFELLGTKNAKTLDDVGSGSIPRKLIDFDSIERDGARIVRCRVKHFTNGRHDGFSSLTFKTSQADDTSRQGSGVDYIWIDEVPPFDDLDIFSSLATRTSADKDENASVIITGTPEKGNTPLVQHFMDAAAKQDQDDFKSLAYLQAGWADAHSDIGGHLTPSMIKNMMSTIPAYQLEMRMTGTPILGDGLVFPYAVRDCVIQPLEDIPPHWKKIAALDIGMGHDTAVTWAVYDPDTDTIIITDIYTAANTTPDIHAIAINKRGKEIPVVLPRDAHQRDKSHGKDMIAYYKEAGVNAYTDTFYNAGRAYKGGKDNTVDTGIVEIAQRLQTKQIKIYATCQDLIRGLETYSFKKGEIDKSGKYDDLIDSFRYAVMSVARRGKSIRDLQRENTPILNTWNPV